MVKACLCFKKLMGASGASCVSSGHVCRKDIPTRPPCPHGLLCSLPQWPPCSGTGCLFLLRMGLSSPRLFPPMVEHWRALGRVGRAVGSPSRWRQTDLALGSTHNPSLAAYPAVCRPAVCRTQGSVMRGSQASLRITIQQLWNTLNREKDSWARLPEGRVLFSVAEPLTTQRCSGLSLAQLRHCVTIPLPRTWSSCP